MLYRTSKTPFASNKFNAWDCEDETELSFAFQLGFNPGQIDSNFILFVVGVQNGLEAKKVEEKDGLDANRQAHIMENFH